MAFLIIKVYQLAAIGTCCFEVLCARLMLFLSFNALLNYHCLVRERIVVVAIVEFRQVLVVNLKDVVSRSTEQIVAGL